MTWGIPRSYPRAILHVDGDAFFAACEVAKNPKLRGKPVITGKERGIVSAATYEAKALGIKRGMHLGEVKKICPQAIILPSDYETYSLFSERMYSIVRRYTPLVDEYGIDECFADLTGLQGPLKMHYRSMADAIKCDLERELNISFSVGLSATKVLAKLGSKWKKPSGLTFIPLTDSQKFLAQTPIGSVWGIGHNTAAHLNKYGIRTALDFAKKNKDWVQSTVAKPYFEVWKELNGETAYHFSNKEREPYKSISKTKTFTPATSNKEFIFSQLSKNVENACIKARRWGLSTPEVFFFLKTQDFKYHGLEIKLSHPTSAPQDILKAITEQFPQVFREKTLYRATGITLTKLRDAGTAQLDLFGSVVKSEGFVRVFTSVDNLSEKYGKHAVFLGSSFTAMNHGAHLGARGDMSARTKDLFKGETFRRRLAIPMLGEVG